MTYYKPILIQNLCLESRIFQNDVFVQSESHICHSQQQHTSTHLTKNNIYRYILRSVVACYLCSIRLSSIANFGSYLIYPIYLKFYRHSRHSDCRASCKIAWLVFFVCNFVGHCKIIIITLISVYYYDSLVLAFKNDVITKVCISKSTKSCND